MIRDDGSVSRGDIFRFPDNERLTIYLTDKDEGPNRLVIDCDLVMKVAIFYIKGYDCSDISKLTGSSQSTIKLYTNKQIDIYLPFILDRYCTDNNISDKLKNYKVKSFDDLANFYKVYKEISELKEGSGERADTNSIRHILESIRTAKRPKKDVADINRYGDYDTYLMIKRTIEHKGGKVSQDTDESWEKLLKAIKDNPKSSLKEFVNMGIEISKARELYIYTKTLQSSCISLGPEKVSELLIDIQDNDEFSKRAKLLFDSVAITLLNQYPFFPHGYEARPYNFDLITFGRLISLAKTCTNQPLFDSSNQVNSISDRAVKFRFKDAGFVEAVLSNYYDSLNLINPKNQN